MPHSLRSAPLLAGSLAAVLLAGAARAQTPPSADPARDALPGKDVFEQNCAACHLHPDLTHAVPIETLRTFPAERINTALTTGLMRAQGSRLSDEERMQVVAYLAADTKATSSTTTTTTTTSTSTTKSPGL